MAYRADIDGMRALAVLMVIGFHALPEVFPGGFIGVDVFFVISGFLITSILAKEADAGRVDLMGFYARRVLRIFPALILVLASCLFLGWHTLLADEYKQLGKHIASGAAFVANFSLWFEAGYFDRISEAKPLLHLWSLGIEEQFYFVWPLLLWCLPKTKWRLMVVVAISSFLASCMLVFYAPTQTFFSPWTRAWELLAGALLALYGTEISKRLRGSVASSVALLTLLGASFFLNSHLPFPGFLALLPVLSAAVFIGGNQQSWVHEHVLRQPWLVKVGLISYPLYLWHWPLLSFAFLVEGGQPALAVRLSLVVLAFLLAAATFLLIEKPFRRIPRKLAVGLLLILMLLLFFLGKNIYDRDGLERIRHKRMINLTEAAQEDFKDFEKTGLITDAQCSHPFHFPERDVCLSSRPNQTATAAIVGDSHALHAYWGMSDYFDSMGQNLVLLGRGACVPLLDYTPEVDINHCQPAMNQTLSYVRDDPHLKSVVLVFRGRYVSNTSSLKAQAMFKDGLAKTLEALTASAKQVYYFLPVVEPGFDPRLCLGDLPMGRKPPFSCEISKAADDEKTATLRRLVSEVLVKFPSVKVVDPNQAFCREGVCPVLLDGHSMFKDDNHISYYGSKAMGRSIELSPHEKRF